MLAVRSFPLLQLHDPRVFAFFSSRSNLRMTYQAPPPGYGFFLACLLSTPLSQKNIPAAYRGINGVQVTY